jgi:hypothetical protein
LRLESPQALGDGGRRDAQMPAEFHRANTAAIVTSQALPQRHPAHVDSVVLLADVYEQQQRHSVPARSRVPPPLSVRV